MNSEFITIRKSIFNNKESTAIAKNSSWLVGEKVFTMLIGTLVMAFVTRYFGPEKYGQFNYALSYTSLFTALSTLGLETLTVKAILDKDYDEGTILCTSLFLRTLGGVVLMTFSTSIIKLIEPSDKDIHLLVFLISVMMIIKSTEVIEYWMQAHLKSKISSFIRILVSMISAILKVTLVFRKGNLVHYALIYLIDSSIIGIALIIAYFKKREEKVRWKIDYSYAKAMLSQSWYLILSGLMITLYMKIDQVMLGSMLQTKTELGIYSAAVQISSMWYFIPTAIITSFNPEIMKKKKYDEKNYLKSLQFLYTIVAWMGIIFGILIFFFSNLIVKTLLGPDYINAVHILSVSVWSGTFAMLGSARGTWLICEGLQKYSMLYIGIGALINIILNYISIPTLGGYGAALATLISQVTVAIIAPSLFKKTRVSSIMILRAFRLNWIIRK